MSDSPLDEVKSVLRTQVHPSLTSEMFSTQRTVVQRCTEAIIVFDIQKQKAAYGARYRDDRPLSAVETYWERYHFDRDTKALRCVGTNQAEGQSRRVSIRSIWHLFQDYVAHLRGLIDRAWP